ncbi:hypothetical protein VA7868_02932 [Vibrio aerogenes CECT 7868]|uniref:Uncharacterized protein n=1 Tax=Vibrio aerogenes CECT 7868 TaxID=1216006 RepID=A0A1M5ZLU9_9VIBR|nr:hypothetical protein [Vibrio aerogenes]SHI25335.1 hypothetical protein VA7868_02932 [Vibrio aerogenes CECT 7868]
MPLLYLIPLVAGAAGTLGFGAGFWSGSGATKMLKLAAIGGGGYLAYKMVKGAK